MCLHSSSESKGYSRACMPVCHEEKWGVGGIITIPTLYELIYEVMGEYTASFKWLI